MKSPRHLEDLKKNKSIALQYVTEDGKLMGYPHNPNGSIFNIAGLTAGGVGIEGVRRILELEHQVAALQSRNEELAAELAATRDALRSAAVTSRRTDPNKLPVVRRPDATSAIVVWRRRRD